MISKKFVTVVLAAALAFTNVPAALVYGEEAPDEVQIATSGTTTVTDLAGLQAAITAGDKDITINGDITIGSGVSLEIPVGVTVTVESGHGIDNEGSFIINGRIENKGVIEMKENCSYKINGSLTNSRKSTFRVHQDLLFDGTGMMIFKVGSKAYITDGGANPYIGPEDSFLFKHESGEITFTKESGKKVKIRVEPSSQVTVCNDAPIWRDQIVYIAPDATLTVNSSKVLTVMDPADGRDSGKIINDGTVNGGGTVNNLGTIINSGTFTVNLTGNKVIQVFTITFDANGGSGAMEPQKVEEGKSITLEENRFTKDGYVFDHWTTEADGSGDVYMDKEEGITPDKSITLYAQWISRNSAFDVSTETVGDYQITYAHRIPFPGKSKLTAESFGENFTVSQGNATYKVRKIKVNKKKKKIQITGLENAPKDVEKAVKKATKGDKGVPYIQDPYYVTDTDKVVFKFKKDGNGTLRFVKVNINGKLYKAKKTECEYDDSITSILFKGDNLAGSRNITI